MMKIIIRGANYKVANLTRYFIERMDELNINYDVLSEGSGSPQTKSSTVIRVYDTFDALRYLKDESVFVEVVEETPEAIYTSVSEKGSKMFDYRINFNDEVHEYEDFEDSEMYDERMRKIGVLV